MAVVEETLEAWHCGCGLGGRDGNFMHDGRLAALEDGLPALAGAGSNEFDQLRLGL